MPCWLRDGTGSLADVQFQAAWVGMEVEHQIALAHDDDATLLRVERGLRRYCMAYREQHEREATA